MVFYLIGVLYLWGTMGIEATTLYKRLADMLALKQGKPYSIVTIWFQFHLGDAILCSAISCIHGSCSLFHHPICEHNLTLACAEGRVHKDDY